jgi:hypothetical protein
VSCKSLITAEVEATLAGPKPFRLVFKDDRGELASLPVESADEGNALASALAEQLGLGLIETGALPPP